MRKIALAFYCALFFLVFMGIILHAFQFSFEEILDVELLVWLIVLSILMFAVYAAVKGS